MVFTRNCEMDSGKAKITNRVKKSGNEKTKMKSAKKLAKSSNPESEEEEEGITSLPSVSAGSSFKVTLKKTRSSSSSTSSRESAQSFEIVRKKLPASASVSGGEENNGNQKDLENKETFNQQQSNHIAGNEKESEEESQNSINSSDDDEIEISSGDSQESFTEKRSLPPTVLVKAEQTIPLNTVVDLKTEEAVPQNDTTVKKEECKINTLKDELLKEVDLEGEVVILNDSAQVSQPQNGVAKKEEAIEQKFKLNVRSLDDLVAPRTVNLMTMAPPGQIDGSPNYLSQNGTPFSSPFINTLCDVCGLQFDSPELLTEHKAAMKHFKCSFKQCEILVLSSQQELLDHQRLIHNIMPSPVQQLAHQVQRLPVMGFEQQLPSGVPPLAENLPPTGVPNMYTQSLRMPNQPVPMQRAIRPMIRPTMSPLMSGRGRNIQRPSRGRPSMNLNVGRGGAMKRPSMPLTQTPPAKRSVTADRNSYTNVVKKSSPQIIKSLSESLTKSITSQSVKKSSASPSQQEVVNLFSKRGLTISTVDSGKNINIPAGLSLNSAVSIIPTSGVSPHKVSNHSVDTVDLTGPDRPREKKFWPCEICSKTYTSVETMYEHISTAHKSSSLSYKCNLCPTSFPSADILNRHKSSCHKAEMNTNTPYVIPILDFTKAGTIAKLKAMGVSNYLPVAQLDNNGGQFGVPIMSVTRPGSVDGLKYANFFNLGCVRKI